MVKVPGGTTKDPIRLFWRDGLECFEHLFSDPTFKGFMEFCPRKMYKNRDASCRIYNDLMTGDFAWDVQVGSSHAFKRYLLIYD